MKRALLHICCGVCASWAIEKLKKDGFEVIGFFYNPNIQPQEEYERRLTVARQVSEIHQIKLLIGPYDTKIWLDQIKGLENEPEGGRRCEECYKLRLESSSRKAKELGINYLGSTLSISPHKNSAIINEIAKSIHGDDFLSYDFKKEDGFKKANEFSKKYGLYRQNYCGCLFSIKPT